MAQSFALQKEYNPIVEEPKLQDWWRENKTYQFDPHDMVRPTYSIDTPPPYPSGEFHVGNALNWCYFDFVARYQRMKGHNVHFPQGWDCHGLPTEVRAEKTLKIRKNQVPPDQFIEMCRKLTVEYIERMKQTISRLGVSTDWKLEYRTMDPSYYKLTQLSFLRLHKSGYMYRGKHPVNWCPRDETAIAEAEVVHVERKSLLHYMKFGGAGIEIEVASTRPELLAACVGIAVNPRDNRYVKLVGQKTIVPIFGQEVPIIAEEEVDPSFGTGADMICTFGDKMDVRLQSKHQLPIIPAIGENGRLTEKAGRFAKLPIEEARKQIVEELKRENRILKIDQSQQSVGTCWRCGTPVEIISRPQWFMKTRDMNRLLTETTHKLRWVPEFAKQRLIDWANSLDWDWVVSRQRIFATPIPVWYCQKCAEVILPSEHQLPVDPRKNPSPEQKCPRCGSLEIQGESDVFDTWMDSSITAAVHAGWPENEDSFKRLFPADLQPNGLDIVRTWDYYLLVRSLALFERAPYKTLLINGMVRGTDGRMMHKSYGNYVETEEALQKFGADALRQWAAAGGSTGYDIPFRWTEVEHGKKFLTKLWNIARYIMTYLTYQTPLVRPEDLTLIDRWLLSSLQKLVSNVTEALDNFQFNSALEAIRDFTWHSVADNYLEAVKYRLNPSATGAGSEAARYCLHECLITICKLISPICPHIAESIFQHLPDRGSSESVHLSRWPIPDSKLMGEKWIMQGEILVETIATSRRRKSEKGLSLKVPVKRLTIRGPEESLNVLRENQETITRTIKVGELVLEPSQSTPSESKEANPLTVDIDA